MEIHLEERLGIVLVPPHLLPVMEQLHVLDVDAGLFRNARTDVADRLLVADPRLDDLWWMLPALPVGCGCGSWEPNLKGICNKSALPPLCCTTALESCQTPNPKAYVPVPETCLNASMVLFASILHLEMAGTMAQSIRTNKLCICYICLEFLLPAIRGGHILGKHSQNENT